MRIGTHSPTPWKANSTPASNYIEDANGRIIAEFDVLAWEEDGRTTTNESALDEANIVYAVECANFCEGIGGDLKNMQSLKALVEVLGSIGADLYEAVHSNRKLDKAWADRALSHMSGEITGDESIPPFFVADTLVQRHEAAKPKYSRDPIADVNERVTIFGSTGAIVTGRVTITIHGSDRSAWIEHDDGYTREVKFDSALIAIRRTEAKPSKSDGDNCYLCTEFNWNDIDNPVDPIEWVSESEAEQKARAHAISMNTNIVVIDPSGSGYKVTPHDFIHRYAIQHRSKGENKSE